MKKILFPLIFLVGSLVHASIAADDASNYVSFSNGSNGGTGFLPWSLSNNNDGTTIYAGSFLGDSTAGAGDVNTSGSAFGLYANPGSAFVNADRAFASALSVGQTFQVDLGVNFDNGNKGFNLLAGSQGEIFNFNVGSGGSVSSSNATLNPVNSQYDYGGNDAVISLALTLTSSSVLSYNVSRVSTQGFQGTLFSGTVSGLTEAPSGFRFYNSGTDNGSAQNNLYFNNLEIIPEPGAALLFLSGIGLIHYLRRRK